MTLRPLHYLKAIQTRATNATKAYHNFAGAQDLFDFGSGPADVYYWPGRFQVADRGKQFAMKISVFIGASVDGFIARLNGDLDFLPSGGGEPHGYEEFMASVDALVIGRKTLETVLTFPEWPYGKKRVVVLSSRPLNFSAVRGGIVEQMAGSPSEIVSKLAASGVQHIYVDGGITIQRFLSAGLIQRLIITRVPVLIGEGIPLFGALPRDIRLRHIATQHYQSGLVKTEYEVAS